MRQADAEPLHARRAYAARRAVKGAPLRIPAGRRKSGAALDRGGWGRMRSRVMKRFSSILFVRR
jgi:hypothetical protein